MQQSWAIVNRENKQSINRENKLSSTGRRGLILICTQLIHCRLVTDPRMTETLKTRRINRLRGDF